MPAITEAEVGTELATDGVLQSVTMTAVPTTFDSSDYFTLTDGEHVLMNMHISTSSIGVGGNILSDGNISFASLMLKACPPGATFDYELAVEPTLASIAPDTAIIGMERELTLVCTGTGFTRGTVIKFAGYDEATDFVSDTEITTIIKTSMFHGPDTIPVSVHTGTLETAPLDFTFVMPEEQDPPAEEPPPEEPPPEEPPPEVVGEERRR